MEFFDAPRQRNISIPLWAMILLVIAYALPGNLGHQPWRGDDALHIGIAYEMMLSGHWLTPSIGGLPWVEMPPLSHWLGAITGTVLQYIMPLADAIRFATVCGLLLSLWLIYQSALALFDETTATAALLLSLGSIGLLVHAHEAQPMIWLLATQTATIYGMSRMKAAPPMKGALVAGAAAGGAFLSAGLSGLALCLPLWAALPLICSECRKPDMLRALSAALSLTLVLCALWPLSLYLGSNHEQDFLRAWWSSELAGISPHGEQLARFGNLGQNFAWFTWPLWPVALWACWRQRRSLREFRYVLLLAALALAVAVTTFTGSLRAANLLPLLPAMIILAASEVTKLRRGAANFFDWFGVMSFCLLGLFLWVAWFALNFGHPAPLARNISRLALDFVPQLSWPLLLLAAALSLGWIIAIVRMPFFPMRGPLHWALGVTLLWGLAGSLWLPWIDHSKSYAQWATEISSLARAETEGETCIASRGAGDSQRAAFYFFEGLHLDPRPDAHTRCPLLLSYASGRGTEPQAPAGWEPIWHNLRGSGRQTDRATLWRPVSGLAKINTP